MLWRILTSLGLWVIVWLALTLIGNFLGSPFLVINATLIGFLAGLLYFFFGGSYYGGPGTGWTRHDRP